MEALHDAELYRMLVPREPGGLQVDPLTFYQVSSLQRPAGGSSALQSSGRC
jgi:hypothetical protein